MGGDLLLAFSAGIVSFAAPCVVPLLPAYVSYLGGAALPEIQRNPAAYQARVLRGGFLYVIGFGVIFVALGVGAGLVGSSLKGQAVLLQRVGGVLVILMGLALLGWLPGRIAERGFSFRAPSGMTASDSAFAPLILGAVFGTAWTPCVGPVLGAILVRAAQRQGALTGGILLLAYTVGLGLPFIFATLGAASFPGFVRPLARFSSGLSKVAGALLVVLGVLLVAGLYQSIAGYLAQPFTLR